VFTNIPIIFSIKCPKQIENTLSSANHKNVIYCPNTDTATCVWHWKILCTAVTQIDMKRGVITILYKGGNKKKTCPYSYRAISLCSTLLKLYEKIVLILVQNDGAIPASLNPAQGGFQKNIRCLMTAFTLSESVHYCR
jgi:hypothetical protein